jgi:D-tyrosyl-tRNA(Tyr) deacylase
VSRAHVDVEGERVAEIGRGLLVLVGVGHDDAVTDASELARKLVGLRIFEDEDGRMNRSLLDGEGDLLIVSQFTLLADTRKGRRPSFGDAAGPGQAEPLVDAVVEAARAEGVRVVTGRFGAHMQVGLDNDGPVTLLIDTKRAF